LSDLLLHLTLFPTNIYLDAMYWS